MLPESLLPPELLLKSISLKDIGITKLAWSFEDVFKVITFLYSVDYAILGGDVYLMKNAEVFSTGDTWYLNKNPNISWYQYLLDSKEKAENYVRKYFERNGSNYIYSVSYTNKQIIKLM